MLMTVEFHLQLHRDALQGRSFAKIWEPRYISSSLAEQD
jgi:hypothetical protein